MTVKLDVETGASPENSPSCHWVSNTARGVKSSNQKILRKLNFSLFQMCYVYVLVKRAADAGRVISEIYFLDENKYEDLRDSRS